MILRGEIKFMCKLSVLSGVLLAVLSGLPASAQVDFTGEWAPLYHEDNPERIPGPELGDYMGIPINNAARLRGDAYDADRISVVTEYQCTVGITPCADWLICASIMNTTTWTNWLRSTRA